MFIRTVDNRANIYGNHSIAYSLTCALDYNEACSTLLHDGATWSLYCQYIFGYCHCFV